MRLGPDDDFRIDVGRDKKPSTNVMQPFDSFQCKDSAGTNQNPGRRLLDGDLDGTERIRRIERDLDRRHAVVDQHADDSLRFLGPHAAQDRDQRALHRRKWDNAHSCILYTFQIDSAAIERPRRTASSAPTDRMGTETVSNAN